MRFGYNYGCVHVHSYKSSNYISYWLESVSLELCFLFPRVVVSLLVSFCDTLLQLQRSIDIIIQDLRLLQPAYTCSYPPASMLVNYAN